MRGIFIVGTCVALAATLPHEDRTPSDLAAALDLDGDGTIGRYEAAAAALRIVDSAAPEPGGTSVDTETAREWLAKNVSPGPADDRLTMTVSPDGTQLVLAGMIDVLSTASFLKMRLTEPGLREIVLRSVTESTGEEATGALARLIAASGLATRIPLRARVAGPGLVLAAAADARFVENESIAPGLRTETDDLKPMNIGTEASLRGLAAVNRDVAWVTGHSGTIARTVDGGKTWQQLAPPSLRNLDARDVHATDAYTAWVLTAGPGEASRILHTTDGGETWTEQHRESAPESFLDGFDFWDEKRAIAYGDPLEDGRFRILVTSDGGATWAPAPGAPEALEPKEAAFAASGTGIVALEGGRAVIVTGANGARARALSTLDYGATWTSATIPIDASSDTSGAFSVSIHAGGAGVAVGGDFADRALGGTACAAYTKDFGATWSPPEVGPRGQRAGSTAITESFFIATGQTGTDISEDGGKTWRALSSRGFHCVDVASDDGTIWFAGPRGRVGRLP